MDIIEDVLKQIFQLFIFLALAIFGFFFLITTLFFSMIMLLFNRQPTIRVFHQRTVFTPQNDLPKTRLHHEENTDEVIDVDYEVKKE